MINPGHAAAMQRDEIRALAANFPKRAQALREAYDVFIVAQPRTPNFDGWVEHMTKFCRLPFKYQGERYGSP